MAASGAASAQPSPPSELLRMAPSQYGESYRPDLIEQYKLYVESADKISDRRTAANHYFLTLNTFLLGSIGVSTLASGTGFLQLIIVLAGILVSVVWFSLIASYRNLNAAKFAVIHELEKQLPARLFAREWEHCEHGQSRAYRPLTHIEKWVPLVFVALYLSLGLLAWMGKPGFAVRPTLPGSTAVPSTPAQAPPRR